MLFKQIKCRTLTSKQWLALLCLHFLLSQNSCITKLVLDPIAALPILEYQWFLHPYVEYLCFLPPLSPVRPPLEAASIQLIEKHLCPCLLPSSKLHCQWNKWMRRRQKYLRPITLIHNFPILMLALHLSVLIGCKCEGGKISDQSH